MSFRIAALILLSAAAAANAAEIKGRVTNVLGGEPLARVEVMVCWRTALRRPRLPKASL
jgi:hypothetical protein